MQRISDRIPRRLSLLTTAAAIAALGAGCGPSKAYVEADALSVEDICPPDEQDFSGSLTRGACSHRLRTYAAEAACHAGNNTGCAYAAAFYGVEESPLFDRDRGIEWAAIGCDRGDPPSCLWQAITLYDGDDDIYENGQAYNLLRRTCLEGMGLSCHRIGGWYRRDAESARDRKLAAGYYKKSCDYGHAPGCREFAKAYAEGFGVARNEKRARELYTKACEMDDAKACRKVGMTPSNEAKEMYDDYSGISTQNMVEMYWSACKNGFRHGCTYLGRLIKGGYLSGRYVFNSDRITKTLETGCELGAAESCYHVARRHLKGYGSVEANTLMAARYAKKACEMGYDKGCERYRNYYYRVFNRNKALAFAQKCRQGDAEACFLSGMAFDYGANFDRQMDQAVAMLDRGCSLDYADACERVGLLYDKGEKVEQDYARANKYFEKACKLGADFACFALAFNHDKGLGVNKDHARSLELDLVACERGWARGCGAAGYHYFAGIGADENHELGRKYSLEACRNDYLWACNNYAMALRDGRGGDKDEEQAAKLFKKNCKRGSGRGCLLYGEMLRDGQATDDGEPDVLEAANYFEMGCLAEDGGSCRALGRLHEEGEHIPKDEDKAFALYTQGCNYEDAEACGSLANAHESAVGTPFNLTKAREFYRRGCEFGGDDADWVCWNYANHLRHGTGGPKRPAKALEIAQEWCEQEDYDHACYQVGQLLEARGDSVATDIAGALRAYMKACKLDYGRSCDALARLMRQQDEFSDNNKAVLSIFKRACKLGEEDACGEAAKLLGTGDGVERDPQFAAKLYERQCELGGPRTCQRISKRFRFGRDGMEKDAARADKLLERAIEGYRKECAENHWWACYQGAHAIAHSRGTDTNFEGARTFLEKHCEAGVKSACLIIAEEYITGEIYGRDPARGMKTLEKHCTAGDKNACNSLAQNLAHLDNGADPNRGAKLLTKLCTEDDFYLACVRVGGWYARGVGVERDTERAHNLMTQGCKDKMRFFCHIGLEDMPFLQPEHVHDLDAFEMAKTGCGDGKGRACLVKGILLQSGLQVDKDLAEAKKAYERSCSEGNSMACSRLEAISKDDAFRKEPSDTTGEAACEAGRAVGCIAAGIDREFSSHAPDRFTKAGDFYSRGCKLGDADACLLHAALRTTSSGPLTGRQYWNVLIRACEQGEARHCAYAGDEIEDHHWELAIKQYRKACQRGQQSSCETLVDNGYAPSSEPKADQKGAAGAKK